MRVDHRLSWFGTSNRCRVSIPPGASGRNIWVEVATVAPSEASTDFSANLAGSGGENNRVRIAWLGGTYLDRTGRDDIQGFQIFRSPTAGSAVSLTQPIDTVAAYPGGWISDGFGLSGFGQGGFGRAATPYQWTSGPLSPGNWQFAVLPYDKAGNLQGSGQTLNAVIKTAPRPPAPALNGPRLSYIYAGAATRQVTLNWNASPSPSS